MGRQLTRVCFGVATGAIVALAFVLGGSVATAAAPVLTVENATDVQFTTATVEGHVNPEGQYTTWRFQYATQADFSDAQDGPSGETETEEDVSGQLGGLQPSTTYHLRLLAENGDGQSEAVAVSTFTTKAVAKPGVSGLSATETAFSGFVNPNAPKSSDELQGGSPEEEAINAAYGTHWWFSCSDPGCSFVGPSEGDLQAGDEATEVTATPTGLQPNKTFDVTLHATNAGGEETETIVGAFTTGAVAPEIYPATLWEPTQTSIQLNAEVNAHNSELTDCHFEYGTGGALDHIAACESPWEGESFSMPSGEGRILVAGSISSLTPGTEYRYRFVAESPAGVVEGPVDSFHTLIPAIDETCPNEEIRAEQHADGLTDCRAWEQVSPQDKHGGDVAGDGKAVVASEEGAAVAYASRIGFEDSTGSGGIGETQYIARRGTSTWSTRAITPTPDPAPSQIFSFGTVAPWFSSDLHTAVVQAFDLPGVSNDVPNASNIYKENTLTGDLFPVEISEKAAENPFISTTFDYGFNKLRASSASLDHVVFSSSIPLLPDAPSNALYDWTGEGLTVASILPDGTPTSGRITASNETPYRNAMSRDGSRLAFLAPAFGSSQLYMRIDNDHTTWVTEPEWAGGPAEAQDVNIELVTDDGHYVFFTTTSRLLEEDENNGPDLYRWEESGDPTSEPNLTLISQSGNVGLTNSGYNMVLGASSDGSRVYYVDPSQALLWVWDHGVNTLVATDISYTYGAGLEKGLGSTAWGPGASRVSDDGGTVAFMTRVNTVKVPFGPTGRFNPHEVVAMYLYDFENHSLACVSCRSSGPPHADVTVDPHATHPTAELNLWALRPNYLSADGRSVFFSTAEKLDPEDVNGTMDVYRYDTEIGTANLISSGRGAAGAWFSDASSSGDDVFLVTRDQLAPQDRDDLVDLYDARVGGGFAAPPPNSATSCSGEACQSEQPPPTHVDPGSAAYSAPGARHRRKYCHRVRHRRRHCHHSRHRHTHRSPHRIAGANLGGLK